MYRQVVRFRPEIEYISWSLPRPAVKFVIPTNKWKIPSLLSIFSQVFLRAWKFILETRMTAYQLNTPLSGWHVEWSQPPSSSLDRSVDGEGWWFKFYPVRALVVFRGFFSVTDEPITTHWYSPILNWNFGLIINYVDRTGERSEPHFRDEQTHDKAWIPGN